MGIGIIEDFECPWSAMMMMSARIVCFTELQRPKRPQQAHRFHPARFVSFNRDCPKDNAEFESSPPARYLRVHAQEGRWSQGGREEGGDRRRYVSALFLDQGARRVGASSIRGPWAIKISNRPHHRAQPCPLLIHELAAVAKGTPNFPSKNTSP